MYAVDVGVRQFFVYFVLQELKCFDIFNRAVLPMGSTRKFTSSLITLFGILNVLVISNVNNFSFSFLLGRNLFTLLCQFPTPRNLQSTVPLALYTCSSNSKEPPKTQCNNCH